MLLKNQSPFLPNPFALDVQKGLSKPAKSIPSKYLYDQRGSELYNEITHHPDYYLTRAELEIVENNKGKLSTLFSGMEFNCIEFGPGEGIKSLILLKQFLKDKHPFSYFIIDISSKYLDALSHSLSSLLRLPVTSINKEFTAGLHHIHLVTEKRTNLVLFLGSSIGNYEPLEAKRFLKRTQKDLHRGDYLLIGFDLKKNIDVLMRAYNDSSGLTRAFNLNVLTRMNRELKTNFKLPQFCHYAPYNVTNSAMESYLISLKKQSVHSRYLNQTFSFDAYEPIHMECSFKYTPSDIAAMAKESGFRVVESFKDEKEYFLLSLWQVEKS